MCGKVPPQGSPGASPDGCPASPRSSQLTIQPLSRAHLGPELRVPARPYGCALRLQMARLQNPPQHPSAALRAGRAGVGWSRQLAKPGVTHAENLLPPSLPSIKRKCTLE